MKKTLFGLLLALGVSLPGLAQENPPIYDMRGDMGLLEDFGPTGACWLDGNRVLISDRRYTVLHIFDLEGRRFRFLDVPQKLGEVNFSAICHWKDNRYFVPGSHYHVKNSTRFVENRSYIGQMVLEQEKLAEGSGKDNYRPDRALRASGFYGESTDTPGEITGMAMDPKHNRVFFGMDKVVAKDGTVVLLEGQLDKFLARSEDFDLKFVKTDLKPANDPNTGTPYQLADLAYIPDKGLLMLFNAETNESKNFGFNQIWFLKGGFGPAKLVSKDLAPGNRASGMAVRPSGKDEYEAVIVCDNNMEDSRIPSRLIHLKGLRLPMK
jgi:hypothetical protein